MMRHGVQLLAYKFVNFENKYKFYFPDFLSLDCNSKKNSLKLNITKKKVQPSNT